MQHSQTVFLLKIQLCLVRGKCAGYFEDSNVTISICFSAKMKHFMMEVLFL